MASLIWEGAGWITTTENMKFRLKMSDGTNMIDSDEGVDLINIVEQQDLSKLSLGQNGDFRYWLGLGYLDYNYDELWAAAEAYYATVNFQPNRFASLGGGAGLINAWGTNVSAGGIPFYGGFYPSVASGGQVVVADIYWEVTNYSCIVELEVQFEMFSWGDDITVYTHSASDVFLQNIGLSINPEAPFASYVSQGTNDTVPKEWVDNYNILVGFVLTMQGESTGSKDIWAADRSTIDSAIADGRIAFDGATISVAPVSFQADALDYTVSILNLGRPEFVNEAQQEPLELQIKSQDYNGEIKIYLVDNESISEVNEAIGDDLADWYGEITEDVVAQYGTLDYDGQKIITDNIVAGETKEYEITYTADNVNIGQTDNMSIFIKYSDNQGLYNTEYDLLPMQSFYTYTDNIEIDIIDVMAEHIEIYNPSDILITQPADIMHHIFGQELGFDKNNIDTPSKAESWDQHERFEMAFSVNEKIDSKKLIQEISQSCKSLPILLNDNLKFITVKNTYTGSENISTIKADDVFNYSFSRTPVDDIVTKVEVKYNKDYGLDTYLDSHIAEARLPFYYENGDIHDNNRQDNYYNIKVSSIDGELDHVNSFLDFECPYIRDPYSASVLGDYLFYWNVNQHNIVDLKLPLNYYALEVGDLIEFDKMMLGKKAYGEKYVLGDNDSMPVRAGQYILPLFMVTETKKGLDSIKIKAIQLHHMANDMLNYKGETYQYIDLLGRTQQSLLGSGDVTGDGLADILDVVIIVQAIIGNETLTDEQIGLADANFDGQVNILDAVILVNRIIS
jgi:hypothetical protein